MRPKVFTLFCFIFLLNLSGFAQKPDKSAKIKYNKGVDLLQDNDFDQALHNFNQALNAFPNFDKALLERGKIYFKQQKYDRALTNFERVIERTNQSGEAYYYRGYHKYK